ncbi:hypothetical protein JCM5296_003498 [Sporobolomyces johnsonii]
MADPFTSSLGSLDLSESDTALDLAVVLSLLETSEQPAATDVADELTSLAAIYDNPAPSLSLYRPPPTSRTPSPPPSWTPTSSSPLRLVLSTTLAPPYDDQALHLVLSLPPGYPSTEPPLIQLQDRYLGNHAVDDHLFGEVLRTFMHDAEAGLASAGVEWTGGVCLFEGIEVVREMCSRWVAGREEEKRKGEEMRKVTGGGYGIDSSLAKGEEGEEEGLEVEAYEERVPVPARKNEVRRAADNAVACPKIVSSEALLDRKSVFVGHAATVHSLDDVRAVMSELLSNNRIARATHNISAYQFITPEGIRHSDNDDDGETAAGSRLAHLLELLDVQNVMVVVTRWFGGIHLGPDRFKDINQAARDALVAGGYLQEPDKKGKGGKGGNAKKR